MGACYSVTLHVCVIDEPGAIKALNEKIKREDGKGVNYGLEKWKAQRFTTETFDDLIRLFLAGWRDQEVTITENEDGTTTYWNCFDASYGWESVMIEMFEELVPYIREDAKLIIFHDSGWCETTIQNGEVQTEYFSESCYYTCVICGEEFYCSDDAEYEECLEQELLEHLEFEHEDEYEKCEEWDSEHIIKTYFEREDD